MPAQGAAAASTGSPSHERTRELTFGASTLNHMAAAIASHFLRRLDQMGFGKVGVACCGPVPAMSKQLADQW